MQMLLEHELKTLDQCFQHFSFPTSYMVIDLETSGFSKNTDVILDAGWATVHEGQIVDYGSRLLDWRQCPQVDCGWLQEQLRRQAQSYEEQGRPHHYSYERLCQEGEHPQQVVSEFATKIYNYLHSGGTIVGHGIWKFDRGFIDKQTERFLQGYVLPWQEDRLLDTGLIEKGIQLGSSPWQGDTLSMWQSRVSPIRAKGVKWSLEAHCAPKYALVRRYMADMQLMHTAAFDCVLTHFLLNTYYQLLEMHHGQRTVLDGLYPSAAAQGQTGINSGPSGLSGDHPPAGA